MGYTKDTLLSEKILVTGKVGTHGIIQRINCPCWASDNTLIIKSKCYEFVYQILKSVDFTNMNRGSTQPLITQTDLKNVKIVVPETSCIKEYESIVLVLMNEWDLNRLQAQKLTGHFIKSDQLFVLK